jgi:hypothetical protein
MSTGYIDFKATSGGTWSLALFLAPNSVGGGYTFCVECDPQAPFPEILPSNAWIDLGQSEWLNSFVFDWGSDDNLVNGTGPYSYQWYCNGTAVSGAANSSWTFTPSSPGTYAVECYVYANSTTDVGSNFFTRSIAFVTVNAAPAPDPVRTVALFRNLRMEVSNGWFHPWGCHFATLD